MLNYLDLLLSANLGECVSISSINSALSSVDINNYCSSEDNTLALFFSARDLLLYVKNKDAEEIQY